MTASANAAVLRPRFPLWFWVTSGLAAVSLGGYLLYTAQRPWSPGYDGGLAAGIVAALLFVNAAAYPARRPLRARPLGTAQRWLQLHIYGTVLAAWLVLLHVGFAAPAGFLGWALLLLSVWTAASGVVGVVLQKALPVLLTGRVRVEALGERIPSLVTALAREADVLVTGASDGLRLAYDTEIKARLAAPAPSWALVFDPGGGREQVMAPLGALEDHVGDTDRRAIAALRSIVSDKCDLDAHLSVQRALRFWLVGHVPPAIVLMALLAVHVFAVAYL